jgi:AMIN domain
VRFKVTRGTVCRVWVSSLETLAVCAVICGCGLQLAQAGQQAATVRHVAVIGDDHDLGVEITATKPITPRTQTVTDPDRLIVDLPEARPDAGLQKVAINRGKLRDVRVGLLSANPPITRVVMDLAAPTEYRVSPLANTIVIKLGNESAAEPAPIVATNNPPSVPRPAETTSALPMPPPEQPTQRSWAHWIMPILVTTSVVAMLVTALIVYIQNRRSRRGT